jgi:membrane-associated phospholipid phosphatase
MLVKQHSMIDVIAGWALSMALYAAAYYSPLKRIFENKEEGLKNEV